MDIELWQMNKIRTFQVIEVIRDPHDKPESKYNPDAGMSKEDEDKYKRLIDENKQLAAKIKEVY